MANLFKTELTENEEFKEAFEEVWFGIWDEKEEEDGNWRVWKGVWKDFLGEQLVEGVGSGQVRGGDGVGDGKQEGGDVSKHFA
jgi:hypothetical protein